MAGRNGKFSDIFNRLESLEVEVFDNNAPRVNETIFHVNEVDDRLQETINHINEIDSRDGMQIENNSKLLYDLTQRLNQVDLTLKDYYQNFLNVDAHIVSLTTQNSKLKLENDLLKQRLDKLDKTHQIKLISVEDRLKHLITTVHDLDKDYNETKTLHLQVGDKEIMRLKKLFDDQVVLNFENVRKLTSEHTTIGKLWENQFNYLKQIVIGNKEEISNLKIPIDTNKQEIKLIKEGNIGYEQLLKDKSVEIAKLAERDTITMKCGLVKLEKELQGQSQHYLELENKFCLKIKEIYDEIMATQSKSIQSNYDQVLQELVKVQSQLDVNIDHLKAKLFGLELNLKFNKGLNASKLELGMEIIKLKSQLTMQVEQESRNMNQKIGKLQDRVKEQSINLVASNVNQVKIQCEVKLLQDYNKTLPPYFKDLESQDKITDDNLEILRQAYSNLKHALIENKKQVIAITNKLAAAEKESGERQQKIELELAEVDSKLGPFNLRNLIKVEIENFIESERRPRGRKISEFFSSQVPFKHFKYHKKYKTNSAGNNNIFTMEPWLELLNFKNLLTEKMMSLQLLGLPNHVKYKGNFVKKAKILRNKRLIKKLVISQNKATSEMKPTLKSKKLLINKVVKNNTQNQYVSGIAYVDQHRKVPKLK